jgi:hemerythrin superfamily protein
MSITRDARDMIARIAGKAKEVGSVLTGERGIYKILSREHGQVTTWMLQVSAASTAGNGVRQDLFGKIRTELLAHAHAEEREFYPPLQKYDETRDLATRGMREHHEIEQLFERLHHDLDMGTSEWNETFDELVRRVKTHVAMEEDDLFPRARKVLSDKEAKEIERRYLEQHEREKKVLAHPPAPVPSPPPPAPA